MTPETLRDLAKQRAEKLGNGGGRITRAMNEAADEIERLRDMLRVAIDDFEGTYGRPNPKFLPNHWVIQARRTLEQSANGETK